MDENANLKFKTNAVSLNKYVCNKIILSTNFIMVIVFAHLMGGKTGDGVFEGWLHYLMVLLFMISGGMLLAIIPITSWKKFIYDEIEFSESEIKIENRTYKLSEKICLKLMITKYEHKPIYTRNYIDSSKNILCIKDHNGVEIKKEFQLKSLKDEKLLISILEKWKELISEKNIELEYYHPFLVKIMNLN